MLTLPRNEHTTRPDFRFRVGENEDKPADHPLGPLLWTQRSLRPGRCRAVAVLVLFATGTILAAAAWLEPDAEGLGTHRQLGLSACPLPMTTGIPCPSCGMTTAFAHAVRGELVAAFVAQPAGFALAFAVVAAGLCSGFTIVTGRAWRLNWYRVNANMVAFAVVGVILAGWAFKVAYTWIGQSTP